MPRSNYLKVMIEQQRKKFHNAFPNFFKSAFFFSVILSVIRDGRSERMETVNENQTIFDRNVIDLNMKASTKDEVIRELATLLYKENYLSKLDDFIASVYEREAEGITGMGNNVAIPHGKSDSVMRAGIAIGKTNKMIHWESYDNQPVNFFFLFAVPDDVSGAKLHLQLLSKVAAKLSDDELLNRLKITHSVDEVIDRLKI